MEWGNQPVQIGILGPFEVHTDDGKSLDIPGARLRGLLVALALTAGHAASKASLVDWIWGENPPADATNSLQQLVSRLRKVLPAGTIEGQVDGYRLTVEPDSVDAVRFERLLNAVQAGADDAARRVRLLREALGLWRGAAMQDVGIQDSPAFDAAAVRLEALRLTTMEERFDAEVGLGRGAELVTELTDLVAAHPLRERLVAALMRSLVAAGRDTEALMAYQRTREVLAEVLGVDPSPELSALHVALLRGELAQRKQDRKTNLRAELTSFVGKEADVAAVRELIADHRLTTIIGPGGAGKTRLATETAHTLLGDLPDGVWLVELAAVGADGDVAQSALAGFGLRDALLGGTSHAEPSDRLVAALRDREALLILDNCEHVIESAAAFAHRVLGECPRLRILATSREPLGITGEALWFVEPLALPSEDSDPAEIEASPAVRLLRDRAGAGRKGLDAHALATMVRVCRALDGMPLAIELAAARLRTMPIDQLAQRLDDRFRLLTGGSRTAWARSRNRRTAGEASISPGPGASPGSASGSTGHSASPVMPRGSRLVARIRSRRHSPSTRCANTAAASITCSQLSRISRVSRSRTAATNRSTDSAFEVSPSRVSRRPSADSAACATSPSAPIAASSTSQAPSGRPGSMAAAVSSASRVFPAPPGPITEPSRCAARSARTAATSASRPTKLVSSARRLDLRGCSRWPSSPRSRATCRADSSGEGSAPSASARASLVL